MKTYNGISHVADPAQGFRFDLSVFPAHYRRRILIPNVRWESGYHPWEASSDLAYGSFRYELEWKDKVYCDISSADVDRATRLVRCECVNRTPLAQNIALHLLASFNFPNVTRTDRAMLPARVTLPQPAR